MISLEGFTQQEIEAAIAKAFPDGLVDQFWFIAHAVEDSKSLYKEYVGEPLSPPFEEMPDDYRKKIVASVVAIWQNPDMSPQDMHNVWMKRQLSSGWKHGGTYDEKSKTSPALVPFHDLNELQKNLTFMMWAMCRALFKLLIVADIAQAAFAAKEKSKIIIPN